MKEAKKSKEAKPAPLPTGSGLIHIVFNGSEISLMKEVIELDQDLAGEVIQIRDDFAVGPLANIGTDEGWAARANWWRELLKHSPYENDPRSFFDDRQTVTQLKSRLDADAGLQVWIWMGQNQHDVCGYYWLIQHFAEYGGRIFVIYLNNLPFISEKGQLFYPSWVHEIQPKELLKARRLARPVTMSEFEIDPDEWTKLCSENSIVRLLEGGKKIVSRDESFYDGEIIKNLTPDWQKASRVLMNTLHRMKVKTGDVFLMWRMKELIRAGKIEVLGDPEKPWKEFDIRRQGAQQAAETVSQEAAP